MVCFQSMATREAPLAGASLGCVRSTPSCNACVPARAVSRAPGIPPSGSSRVRGPHLTDDPARGRCQLLRGAECATRRLHIVNHSGEDVGQTGSERGPQQPESPGGSRWYTGSLAQVTVVTVLIDVFCFAPRNRVGRPVTSRLHGDASRPVTHPRPLLHWPHGRQEGPDRCIRSQFPPCVKKPANFRRLFRGPAHPRPATAEN